MQPQFRHGLAGVEFEIPGDPVALFRRGIIRRQRRKEVIAKAADSAAREKFMMFLPETWPP